MTQVRAATPADAAAIVAVRIVSWRATYGPYLPEHVWDEIDPAENVRRIEQRFEDGTARAFVAEVDGVIRAFTTFGAARDDDAPGDAEIYAIYAHPDHLSTGLGRALLTAALGVIEIRPVRLWVLENNDRARRFYEIAGFGWDGSRKAAELLGGVELPEVRYRLD